MLGDLDVADSCRGCLGLLALNRSHLGEQLYLYESSGRQV